MGKSWEDLWDRIKQVNILIIGLTEGKEKDKGEGNLFKEIIAQSFPNLEIDVTYRDKNVKGLQ